MAKIYVECEGCGGMIPVIPDGEPMQEVMCATCGWETKVWDTGRSAVFGYLVLFGVVLVVWGVYLVYGGG